MKVLKGEKRCPDHSSLKARFHFFFGGKTVDRNGIGFTEKEKISWFLLKVW